MTATIDERRTLDIPRMCCLPEIIFHHIAAPPFRHVRQHAAAMRIIGPSHQNRQGHLPNSHRTNPATPPTSLFHTRTRDPAHIGTYALPVPIGGGPVNVSATDLRRK